MLIIGSGWSKKMQSRRNIAESNPRMVQERNYERYPSFHLVWEEMDEEKRKTKVPNCTNWKTKHKETLL